MEMKLVRRREFVRERFRRTREWRRVMRLGFCRTHPVGKILY